MMRTREGSRNRRQRGRLVGCLAVGFGIFAFLAACGGDAPFEQVRYSLSNGLREVVFEDMCWAGIEGQRDPSSAWGSGALRMCHPNQAFEDRLEAMVPIAPGEVRVDDGLPVIVRTDLPHRAEE